MSDIKIYGRLVSGTASKELAKADEISIEAIDGVEATTVQDALEDIASSSGGYEPPVGGIPKTDLASDVQTSLGLADTALQSSDISGLASTTYVDNAVAGLVNSAPDKLNTLDELAAALGDDENFATTVTNALAGKQATLVKGTNLDAEPTNGSDNPVTSDGVYDALDGKVDKVSGKGLSTEDYTTAEKTKLGALPSNSDLETALGGKVDKNGTDSLMTAAEHTKLSGIATGAEVNVQSDWNQTTTTADDYIKNKPTLATVATSGSYNDLSNKPTIPDAQVQSDWEASSGMGAILNKPTLASVATSGSYEDLSNKPTIPDDLADLNDDSTHRLVTDAEKTAWGAKQAALESGTNIKTVNNNSLLGSGNITIEAEDGVGFDSVSTPSTPDGTILITLTNGDTITIDLSHTHPDKQDVLTAGSGISISNGVISATGGSGGSAVQSNWNETDTTSAAYIQNKPTIPTVPTNVSSFTNDAGYLTSHQSLSGYVQSSSITNIVVCADETAYNAITSKDSNTLYLIKDSNV